VSSPERSEGIGAAKGPAFLVPGRIRPRIANI